MSNKHKLTFSLLSHITVEADSVEEAREEIQRYLLEEGLYSEDSGSRLVFFEEDEYEDEEVEEEDN